MLIALLFEAHANGTTWEQAKIIFEKQSQIEVIDPNKDQRFKALQDRLEKMFHQLLLKKDGDDPIPLVLLKDDSVNAFLGRWKESGEKRAVFINIGLLSAVRNDDELAFVLSHELEHLTSEIEQSVRTTLKSDQLEDGLGSLATRAVEVEVDAKAVANRMVKQGYNPRAARDFSKRLYDPYTDLGDHSHTSWRTRIVALDFTEFYLRRTKGEILPRSYRNEVLNQDTKNLLKETKNSIRNPEAFRSNDPWVEKIINEPSEVVADFYRSPTWKKAQTSLVDQWVDEKLEKILHVLEKPSAIYKYSKEYVSALKRLSIMEKLYTLAPSAVWETRSNFLKKNYKPGPREALILATAENFEANGNYADFHTIEDQLNDELSVVFNEYHALRRMSSKAQKLIQQTDDIEVRALLEEDLKIWKTRTKNILKETDLGKMLRFIKPGQRRKAMSRFERDVVLLEMKFPISKYAQGLTDRVKTLRLEGSDFLFIEKADEANKAKYLENLQQYSRTWTDYIKNAFVVPKLRTSFPTELSCPRPMQKAVIEALFSEQQKQTKEFLRSKISREEFLSVTEFFNQQLQGLKRTKEEIISAVGATKFSEFTSSWESAVSMLPEPASAELLWDKLRQTKSTESTQAKPQRLTNQDIRDSHVEYVDTTFEETKGSIVDRAAQLRYARPQEQRKLFRYLLEEEQPELIPTILTRLRRGSPLYDDFVTIEDFVFLNERLLKDTRFPNARERLAALNQSVVTLRFKDTNQLLQFLALRGKDLTERIANGALDPKLLQLFEDLASLDQLKPKSFVTSDAISQLVGAVDSIKLNSKEEVRLLQLISDLDHSRITPAVGRIAGDTIDKLLKTSTTDATVKAALKNERLVRMISLPETQIRLAQFQIKERIDIQAIQKTLKSRPLVPRDSIRKEILAAKETIAKQFPKNGFALNKITEWLEDEVLTTRAESNLFESYRLSTSDVLKDPKVGLIDLPAILSSPRDPIRQQFSLLEILLRRRDPKDFITTPFHKELIKKIKLSFGYSHKTKVSDVEVLRRLQDSFQTLDPPARTAALTYFFEDHRGLLTHPEIKDRVMRLILGELVDQEPVRLLYTAYLGSVGPGERRIILANMLQNIVGSSGASSGSLKSVLEGMGPFGVKAGQFLKASGLLPAELKHELDSFFDNALKPTRAELHQSIDEMVKYTDAKFIGTGDILGSGSVNYGAVVYLQDPKTKEVKRFVVRMQKENIEGLVHNEASIWTSVAKKLRENGTAKATKLARVIEETEKSVTYALGRGGAELDHRVDAKVHPNVEAVYQRVQGQDGSEISISVAKPRTDLTTGWPDEIKKTYSLYPFEESTKLFESKNKNEISKRIIDVELKAIFQKGQFDPDPHPGNWLISPNEKHLTRIDYSQFTKLTDSERRGLKNAFGQLAAKGFMGDSNFSKEETKMLSKNLSQIFSSDRKLSGIEQDIEKILEDPSIHQLKTPHEKIYQLREKLEEQLGKRLGGTAHVNLKPGPQAGLASIVKLNAYVTDGYLSEDEYRMLIAQHVFNEDVKSAPRARKKGKASCDLASVVNVLRE